MALTRDGVLLSWGTGQQGQLGRVGSRMRNLKDTLLRPHPVPFTRRIRGIGATKVRLRLPKRSHTISMMNRLRARHSNLCHVHEKGTGILTCNVASKVSGIASIVIGGNRRKCIACFNGMACFHGMAN
jgi:alpha-tubulin suppressor-like RCC1 family protein